MSVLSKLFNKKREDNQQLTLHEKWEKDSESYNNPNYHVKTGENQCYRCANKIKGDALKCSKYESIPKEIILDKLKCDFRKEVSNYKNIYEYEFIPYKKIGTIALDKEISEEEFKPSGEKYLYENGINHVICNALSIDYAQSKEGNDKVIIKYNNMEVELTCFFDKFINNLSKICDDIKIIESDKEEKNKWKKAYSKKLGIFIHATEEINNYLIQVIVFAGKTVFDKKIKEVSIKDE